MITQDSTQSGWWSVLWSATRSRDTLTSAYILEENGVCCGVLLVVEQNMKTFLVQVSLWTMVGEGRGRRQPGEDPGRRADDASHRE